MKMYPTFDAAWADYVCLMFGTNQPAKALALANQYAAANPNRASGALHLCFRSGHGQEVRPGHGGVPEGPCKLTPSR